MNPEKRVIVAIFLSIVFCAIWMNIMQKKYKKWKVDNPKKQTQLNTQKDKLDTQKDKNGKGKINKKKLNKTQNDNKKNDKVDIKKVNKVDPDEKKKADFGKNLKYVIIDTKKYRMKWTNQGATLCWLKLKEYCHRYTDKEKKGWKENPENWLKVIPDFSSKVRSFSLKDKFNFKIDLDNELWKIKEQKQDSLKFEIGPIEGIKYYKYFFFNEKEYFFKGEIGIENLGTKVQKKKLEIGTGAGIVLENSNVNTVHRAFYAYAMYPNKKNKPLFKDFDYSDMTGDKIKIDGNVNWVCLINRYFGYIFNVQDHKKISSVHSKTFKIEKNWIQTIVKRHKEKGETPPSKELKKLKQPMLVCSSKVFNLKPNEKESINFKFHLATKRYLSKIDKNYSVVDDYGFFGIISGLLLGILGTFYQFVHNYGIAIILLTLLIKLCLFPLTKKQQISMQNYQDQMKKFQPQLKSLQEKYKNNKQKLNQEVMNLYKKHGVNPIPLGGCLPIFLQLPIFIGLYQALYYSIDLRQASFLWIRDLSQPDHFFQFGSYVAYLGDYLNILPIIMTVMWIVQQKLTPKPTDPQMQQQQKMFMFMPIFFAFILYHVASGLVLYWLTMNFFGIIEQSVIKKYKKALASSS